MSHAIYHDLTIKSPREKVFDAITSPVHLVNWWPLKSEGVPKEGATYNFNFTDEYDWYGVVIKVEDLKSFHIKMTTSDDDWNATTFGFDLEELNGNTKLKFCHTNWKNCNDEFRQSSYCWAILLKGLKDYLENGIIIPFENRN
jgi:uncharacterized protein YndB with AHSA1/START domain